MQPALATSPNSALPLAVGSKRRAAGILFTTADGKALFMRRTGGDHDGQWAFPGGMIEDGETPEQAARRETVEETGMLPRWEIERIGTDQEEGGEYESEPEEGEAPVEFISFRQQVPQEFIPTLNHEHSNYVWAPLHDPPRPLHPGVYRLIRAGYPDALASGGWDDVGIEIDREHDGPWMSCMSLNGRKMYVNRSLPDAVEIAGKQVQIDRVLKAHEMPEWADLQSRMNEFKFEKMREPDTEERIKLYLRAHKKVGTPSEREYCKARGIDWKAWSAWCRGEESRIEKGPFKNQPEDADVKPIPHDHGELAATDSALQLALDRESVRQVDKDGRMRVARTAISKATVNPYRGSEIPGWEELGLDPDRVYQLLRDPEEMRKAAPTFNGVQLLRKHIPVSADDHQPYDVVGTTGTDAKFEDPYLFNSLSVWAKDAIEGIESKEKCELSCGYHYIPVMKEGTFRGQHFDGIMTSIVGNHVALVEDGRAGPDVVVGDSADEMQWGTLEFALLSFSR